MMPINGLYKSESSIQREGGRDHRVQFERGPKSSLRTAIKGSGPSPSPCGLEQVTELTLPQVPHLQNGACKASHYRRRLCGLNTMTHEKHRSPKGSITQ